MTNAASTVAALQVTLGLHIRRLRLARNLCVEVVAERTGLAEKSVRNLESGRGSTTATLMKVLSAVDAGRVLRALAPLDGEASSIKPPKLRQRARRPNPNEPA
jgi:transcriptional regulator with XRE-family HTH domain